MGARIIAASGKGGVGKTAISAALLRALVEQRPGARVLAIDADPAVGLATALGLEPERTLDDIRKELADARADTEELAAEARFRLLDAMEETNGFAFLAIGRPESAGCYCAVNGCLRAVVGTLAGDFDYVIIDGEAGIEQINRRVMERVTHLLLVSDQSRKGIAVAQTIRRVAERLVMYESCGLVINRATRPELTAQLPLGELPLLGVIGPDAAQARFDAAGRSVFELPPDAPVLAGARGLLSNWL